MNNSLERIFEAIMQVLSEDVVPRVDDAFARGQAIAVVDILRNLKPRVEWSQPMLRRQIEAQEAAVRAVEELCAGAAPSPPATPAMAAPARHPSAAELAARRDQLERHICQLLRWLAAHRGEMAADRAAAVDAQLHGYMKEQLDRELAMTANPLFAEISRGNN